MKCTISNINFILATMIKGGKRKIGFHFWVSRLRLQSVVKCIDISFSVSKTTHIEREIPKGYRSRSQSN